mmetsp:Transcript_13840/g.29996  ORF Transcript_13840/g.29996 Transcript_13840/m.29996 type:complete len:208 (-) Transcript_13840:392-1015(-)
MSEQIAICLYSCGLWARQAVWLKYWKVKTLAPPSEAPGMSFGVWISTKSCSRLKLRNCWVILVLTRMIECEVSVLKSSQRVLSRVFGFTLIWPSLEEAPSSSSSLGSSRMLLFASDTWKGRVCVLKDTTWMVSIQNSNSLMEHASTLLAFNRPVTSIIDSLGMELMNFTKSLLMLGVSVLFAKPQACRVCSCSLSTMKAALPLAREV